jgi:hypothetical protein
VHPPIEVQRSITASCGQEAFFDGHVHAFRTLGGIPGGQIRYDNLSPAVSRVIHRSRSREEHPRWADFRKHFSITPFYCGRAFAGPQEGRGRGSGGLLAAELSPRRGDTFTPVHEAFWPTAKHALGETERTKALVQILVVHRHLQHRDVVAGIHTALAVGACTADVVALEA